MARAAARKRPDDDDSKPEGGFVARLARLVKSLFVSEDADEESSRHAREVLGIVMLFASLWLFVAMLSYYRPYDDPGGSGMNWGGRVGHYLATAAHSIAGAAGLMFAFLGGCWGVVLVARKSVPKAPLRLLSAIAFTLALGFLLHMTFRGPDGNFDPHGQLPFGAGGWLANAATPALEDKFGGPGLWILMIAVALVSFMLATNMAFYPLLVELRQWADRRREERGESFPRAAVHFVGGLFTGLWSFLRGSKLDAAPSEARGANGMLFDDADVATPPAPAAKRGKSAEATAAAASAASTPKPPIASSDFDEDDPRLHGMGESELEDGESSDEVDEDSIAVSAASQFDDDEFEAATDDATDDAGARAGAAEDDDAVAEDADDAASDGEEADDVALVPAGSSSKAKPAMKSTQKGLVQDLPFAPPTPPPGEWKLPPLDLLEPPDRGAGLDEKSLEAQARKLEAALASFHVEARVCRAQVGPTVILFELEVVQGTRMNKVTQLSQEIAAALRAQSVRIIAPIPGKDTIGVEVPNGARRRVRISELVSQSAYDRKVSALPLFLGVDAEGNPIVEDLARMPHLLIAGTTGSGKSVCINTILASFLLTRSPHDVQMILIDPKMVELQAFAKIPHLMLDVVTDMRQATKVIEWAVEKMEGRYELFRVAGVKNIKGYNALGEEELRRRLGDEFTERTPRHVPYIVLVVDEFADLMMQAKKEAEQAITRLAQKSRAVGIHVILATQRPSTDVITGVIKGNLPTRIAFQVASKVDSRVILDSMGAEKLLGGGDMLYTPPQSSRIKRVQGALVEDHELQALVDFVCQNSAPSFNQELVQLATGSAQPGAGEGFETALDDPMWDEAVRVILKSKRGSASLLQRALGVGYTRASRLLDMMGEAGIVSDHKGSKAREVLMTLEQWEEQHGSPLPGGSKGGDE